MGYRGRLLFPMLIGFARSDPPNADQDANKQQVKTSRPFGARGPRTLGRAELPEVQVEAQVEVFNINAQRIGPAGDVPDYRTAFVCHYEDLEVEGLVDAATGKPLLQPGTRVTAIYTLDGDVERLFDSPQVFVTEARDLGYGFDGRRNLLMLITDDRPQGLTTAPG